MPKFNDQYSQFGFLGKYQSVDQIRKRDKQELKKLGTSYKELADIMEYFWEAGIHMQNIRANFYQMFGLQGEHLWKELYENIRVLDKGRFRFARFEVGFSHNNQDCPFRFCSYQWNSEIVWQNTETEIPLIVNDGIIHLAREHKFILKSSKYGTTPERIYNNFWIPDEPLKSLEELADSCSYLVTEMKAQKERLYKIEQERKRIEYEKRFEEAIKKLEAMPGVFKRKRENGI